MVVPFRVILTMFFLASSMPLRIASRNFSSLAQAVANGALAVADNNQRGELHDTAALDGLGNTVERNDLLDTQFRSVVRLS